MNDVSAYLEQVDDIYVTDAYPWTVIPVECRDEYMAALEAASVEQNIVPFTEFLARLVDAGLKGEHVPKIPDGKN